MVQLQRDILGLASPRADREPVGLGCLTNWRMHVPRHLLRSTDLGVVGVARRVGYDAEGAFGRALKRSGGTSPGSWRMANSGG